MQQSSELFTNSSTLTVLFPILGWRLLSAMSALLLTAQNARGSRQFVTQQQPYFGATLVSTAGTGLFRGLPTACQTQNRELVSFGSPKH